MLALAMLVLAMLVLAMLVLAMRHLQLQLTRLRCVNIAAKAKKRTRHNTQRAVHEFRCQWSFDRSRTIPIAAMLRAALSAVSIATTTATATSTVASHWAAGGQQRLPHARGLRLAVALKGSG